jgi:hypothetical protein
MTDDDKLIESMFDGVIETSIKPDGEVEVKLVSPSAEEMEEAQADFIQAEKRFREINANPEAVTDARLNIRWWNCLEKLYESEKELVRLFCGPDRSLRSIAQYNAYRERLIRGNRLYRTDA